MSKKFSRKKTAVVFSAIALFAFGIVMYTQSTYTVIGNIVGDNATDEIFDADIAAVDYAHREENSDSVAGIVLDMLDGIVFVASPPDGTVQISEDNVKTNSTHIRVSVDDFADSDNIALYLFDSKDTKNPIGYATLSKTSNEAVFDNLAFSKAYAVGVSPDGKNGAVEVRITD
jgi:hypothetical protein